MYFKQYDENDYILLPPCASSIQLILNHQKNQSKTRKKTVGSEGVPHQQPEKEVGGEGAPQ